MPFQGFIWLGLFNEKPLAHKGTQCYLFRLNNQRPESGYSKKMGQKSPIARPILSYPCPGGNPWPHKALGVELFIPSMCCVWLSGVVALGGLRSSWQCLAGVQGQRAQLPGNHARGPTGRK